MASNSHGAAVLARAIQASIEGDSSVIAEIYSDDVQGWSPALTISSTAELAVEFEDRDEALSDITLDFTALDVGDDRACIEWVATATHSGPLVSDDETLIEATSEARDAPRGDHRRLQGQQDPRLPSVLGRGRSPRTTRPAPRRLDKRRAPRRTDRRGSAPPSAASRSSLSGRPRTRPMSITAIVAPMSGANA